MPANLGFGITGVNTATLLYSIVFTVVTLITSPIVKRLGAHKWIPILMSSWAIVTWAHALLQVSYIDNYDIILLKINFFS